MKRPRYIPVKVTGKIKGIPIRPLVVGVRKFLDRWNEDGVERTIKIDECDRIGFSKDLVKWLKKFDAVQRRTAKSTLQLP